MDYFQLLHLNREPFSNSPDPEFFYATRAYTEGLQKLEIALRLQRGLNLVLGDVGTGKTTLSRVLLRAFENERGRFRIHLLLDPGFDSDRGMLEYLLRLFDGHRPEGASVTEMKDRLQHALLQQSVVEGRVVILLIDEGQKLSPSGLEILRELLNFESNEHKLLQVVVFAQLEFWERIREMRNLLDRVNLIVRLRPLTLHETRAMVRHRLVQAGMSPDRALFRDSAVRRIHRMTGGHPRKIIHLCHQAMLQTLVAQREQVTNAAVNRAFGEMQDVLLGGRSPSRRAGWAWGALGALLAGGVLVGGALVALGPGGADRPPEPAPPAQVLVPEATPALLEPPSPPPSLPEAPQGVGAEAAAILSFEEGIPVEPAAVPQNPEPAIPRQWSSREWFQAHPPETRDLDLGRRVVVRRGETLSGIVERQFGLPLEPQWLRRFQRANPNLANPHRLNPGDTLILPPMGEVSPGTYGEPMGWFPSEESADQWARTLVRTRGPVFLTRAEREGVAVYGVLVESRRDSDPADSTGRAARVWVGQDDVVRVLGERENTGPRSDP